MLLLRIVLSGNGFVYNDVTMILTVRRPGAFKLYFPFLLSSFLRALEHVYYSHTEIHELIDSILSYYAQHYCE